MMKKSVFAVLIASCIGILLMSCGKENAPETVNGEEAENKSSVTDRTQKDGFDENTNMEVQLGNYIFSIPSYYDPDITESDHYRAYAETGGKVAYVEIFSLTDEEDPVSYEASIEEVENGKSQEAFESWFDSCEGMTTLPLETDCIKGFLHSTNYTKGDNTGYCQCMVFPSVDDNRWVFVVLNQTDGTEYSYTDDFKKMLKAIKNAETSGLNAQTEEKTEEESYQEVKCGGVVFLLPEDFEWNGQNDKGYSCYGWEKGKRIEAALFDSIESIMTDEEFNLKKEEIFDKVEEPWDISSEIREKAIAGLGAYEAEYVDLTGPIDKKMHVLLINNPMQGQVIVVMFPYTDNIGERGERDYQELCDTAYIAGEGGDNAGDTSDSKGDTDNPFGVDPDLKAFLDSYESFVDEYVDFMKSYLDDPANVISMLSEYTDIIGRLEDYEDKVDAYNTDEMSEADLNYYLEVTSRCAQKMMSVY